jgi:ligand-binding sensor protein
MDISKELKQLKRLTKYLATSPFVESNKKLQEKLLVFSNPKRSTENLKLTDIISVELLQVLQDKFSETYNIASVIYDEYGVLITRPSNFSKFCKLLRTSELGLYRCDLSKERHYKKAVEKGGVCLDVCQNFSELLDCSIPFGVEGRRVGTWCVGQRAVKELKENKVKKYAKEVGVDPNELWEYSKLLSTGTREDYQKVIDFLSAICEALSVLGLQNIQQAKELYKRKLLELELEKTNKILRVMLDTIPLMVWIKDSEKKFLWANKLTCNILLHTNITEVVGKDGGFFEDREKLLSPGNNKWYSFGRACHVSDNKVLSAGKLIHIVEQGYIRGVLYKLEIWKSPVFDDEGNVVGVVGAGKFIE